MTRTYMRGIAAALLTVVAASACSTTAREVVQTSPQPATAPQPAAAAQDDAAAIAEARADSVRRPWTAADAHFMTMMIGHHAQALTMSAMAPTHGASEQVRTLAARIASGQRDEIRRMQQWLRERQQPVPDPLAAGAPAAAHGGAHHPTDSMQSHAGHQMLMPGMLTEAQLRELDAARGSEFDRLFLLYMIQHHQGAVSMVKELFGSYGAGQDETVFKLASDVNVDQLTEIARMERMLLALQFGITPP